MKQGKVKFYNNAKGYGFIQPEGSGEDVFIHRSGLLENINEDDKVSYDEEPGKTGKMNAVNVKIVND